MNGGNSGYMQHQKHDFGSGAAPSRGMNRTVRAGPYNDHVINGGGGGPRESHHMREGRDGGMMNGAGGLSNGGAPGRGRGMNIPRY